MNSHQAPIFELNDKLYIKDPASSKLGKKILKHSIILIDLVGFESFTFKRLGKEIGSNESSVYRYFENKHKLLLYLSSWYWTWMEYKLHIAIQELTDPLDRLHRMIEELTAEIQDDATTEYINEAILNRIIIAEYFKTFHNKEVDTENQNGFYRVYIKIIHLLASSISAVNPSYKFSKTLASSIVSGTLNQHFFKQHLKTITDFSNKQALLSPFYIESVDKILL